LASIGIHAVADAAIGLGGALVSPIQAASDLNESLSKSQAVFGASADVIEQFASTAAQSLGQSRAEAIAAAGDFGNLFTAMGLGQPEAAKLSTQIVSLATDLASFDNLSPQDVLEKLRSGLVGESEPLRALGVNLNEATVAQEAMRLGLSTSAATLTESA